MTNEDFNVVKILFLIGFSSLLLIILIFWAWPIYNIWQREQSGKAELAEAEWSKKVQIEQAKANLDSEKLNAQAEIERAKGMAEAIRIEGGSLTTEYIQYLWVRQNIFNDKTTIYIPTEANLPILEADRLNQKAETK
jgi:hypothetical protein